MIHARSRDGMFGLATRICSSWAPVDLVARWPQKLRSLLSRPDPVERRVSRSPVHPLGRKRAAEPHRLIGIDARIEPGTLLLLG